jgi:hypothetical protein
MFFFCYYSLLMAATSVPKEVVQLVERFERNRDAYVSGGLNETQLRQELRQDASQPELHKDLPKAHAAPDKTAIERQIAATDRQIDALVYELYGLTEDEITVIKGEEE